MNILREWDTVLRTNVLTQWILFITLKRSFVLCMWYVHAQQGQKEHFRLTAPRFLNAKLESRLCGWTMLFLHEL